MSYTSNEIQDISIELIAAIKEVLQENDISDKEDIADILKQIEEDLCVNRKPKKGFFSALKTLCAGNNTPVILLVAALIQLFSAFAKSRLISKSKT